MGKVNKGEKIECRGIKLLKKGKVELNYVHDNILKKKYIIGDGEFWGGEKMINVSTEDVSELLRAQQTAAVYKQYFDVPLISDRRLNEIDVGSFEGRYFDDLRKEHGVVFDLWAAGDFYNVNIPGGEQFIDIEKRLRDFIADLHNPSLKNQNILIVSHYVIIKMFISIIFTENLSASNSMRIDLGNITKLSLEKSNKWSLQYFNLPIIR